MAVSTVQIKISDAEFKARRDLLREYIVGEKYSGVVLFDNYYILYYTGFAFIPTERPIGFVMSAAGELAMFVPRMESEHAAANTSVDHVDFYKEYPDEPHPMKVLAKTLKTMKITGEVGADNDGYPWILGYRGPLLSEIANVTTHNVRAFVEDQMAVKSEAELNLMRESIRWGNLAHVLLQRYTKVGATETEVTMRATNEATLAMVDAIGPIYKAQDWLSGKASADYRGQNRPHAAIPHALAKHLTVPPGAGRETS